MWKNNKSTQNNESKFKEWLQCQPGKSKTNIIFEELYDTKVAYLKIMNQGTDEHDFLEKIEKSPKKPVWVNELSAVKSKGYSACPQQG